MLGDLIDGAMRNIRMPPGQNASTVSSGNDADVPPLGMPPHVDSPAASGLRRQAEGDWASSLLEPDPRGRGSQYPAPTARHGDSSVRSGLQPVSLIAITRPPPHIFGRNSSKRRRVDPRILLRALARSCDPAAGSGSVAAHLISYLGYSSAQ